MKIKDVMHKGVTCVEPGTPVTEIARRMRDDDVGAIPVRADGQLVGMITDRDITCRAVADGGNLGKLTALDVMTKDIASCSPDDDIVVAIKAMERRNSSPAGDRQPQGRGGHVKSWRHFAQGSEGVVRRGAARGFRTPPLR